MTDTTDESGNDWTHTQMFCAICNREWVAVHAESTPRLECPTCGYYNGAEPRDTSEVDG